jgi:hypothetical protein
VIKLATHQRDMRKDVIKKYANTTNYNTVAFNVFTVAIDYTITTAIAKRPASHSLLCKLVRRKPLKKKSLETEIQSSNRPLGHCMRIRRISLKF